MPAKISLLKKVYRITLSDKCRNGDEVSLTTYADADPKQFKIGDDFHEDKLSIAWKTLPELSTYFRNLADAIDLLAKEVKKL